MERRTRQVAEAVKATIAAAGVSYESVASAADITVTELEARLDGVVPFEITVLSHVGGFLRVPATQFLEGVA